ncbi:MAG: integrase core domain-containing protein [Fuerstiella sp.]|nr:integrase core domain-containing protein [Fuerstiella sp.]
MPIDQYPHESLSIDVSRRMTSESVLERLSDLFIRRGVPDHMRTDNGSEFTVVSIREWQGRFGVQMLFIEPGSPWENGHIESFNGSLRQQCPNQHWFLFLEYTARKVERWRDDYNRRRPHSSLVIGH